MNWKKFTTCLLSAFAILVTTMLCSSCEHRPLEDKENYGNHFLRVYFDEEIRNVTFGFYDESKKRPEYSSPEVLKVVVCDEVSGSKQSEHFLYDNGRDERGYYIQGSIGIPDGRYNILAYNFDTKETQIKRENSYTMMTAYTEPLSESEANRLFASRGDYTNICRQSDHLFVARLEGVKTSMSDIWEKLDTLKDDRGEHPVAKSIVKTYYLQFNVKGVEYVRSAVALISGMAGSKTMHDDRMVEEDISSIYFSLNNGKEKYRTSDDVAVAYASFNTFGKLPDVEGYLDITFEFNTVYNTVQTETVRVTDIFETEMAKEKQWILIDKTIEIIPPEVGTGGGMSPGVNDWEQIEGNITI